jgi:1-acyl-sn-glycerol-3-phosphate acyltransferase
VPGNGPNLELGGSRPACARWQLARFALAGLLPGGRAATRAVGGLLYAGYAWAVTVTVGSLVWLLVVTLPGLRARWAVLRAAAWLLRCLLGIPLTVSGRAPDGGPFVTVANHGSFIDGLVLVLCLPDPVCFAVAEKFATGRITGLFLRRIGAQFVHRAQPQQAATSTAQLAAVLAAGRSLAIWPEGALDPAPGLRPFHLGAFEAAASAGAPVVPVGIRGSRELLRPGRRFPHRTALHVAITDPIPPAGPGWHAALALRDQARTAILALSGEPDTGGQPNTSAVGAPAQPQTKPS